MSKILSQIRIFRMLTKFSIIYVNFLEKIPQSNLFKNEPISFSDGSTTSLRSKTLTLELIVSIMENPGPTFSARDEFRDIVKEHLCDSILKNSVSTDKPVFAYSLGAFVALVK